jgi:hypothetical protein
MVLHTSTGKGLKIIRTKLSALSRISILINGDLPAINKKDLNIVIHGFDQHGNYRMELIQSSQIISMEQWGYAVSTILYSNVDYVYIQNANRAGIVTVSSFDTTQEDISLLLPLWGNVIETTKANQIIDRIFSDQRWFLSPFGIRTYPDPNYAVIQLPWNILLGQGLLKYNRREHAADLFTRHIKAILENINNSGCFFSAYDAKTGVGIGSENDMDGLIPIGYFLQVLGVQIINEQELIIEGKNPFPWPVELRYRGMIIYRDQDQTRIEIPGKETKIIQDPRRVHLKYN